MTKKTLLIWGTVAILGLGIGIRLALPPQSPSPLSTRPISRVSLTPKLTPAPVMIQVQVSGEVAKPGVFSVPKGTRVQEVIALAGGSFSGADDRAINYSGKLRDGQHIHIPPRKTPRLSRHKTERPSPSDFNINTASARDLVDHFDISKKSATTIVRYRSRMGWIQSEDELASLSDLPTKDRSKFSSGSPTSFRR